MLLSLLLTAVPSAAAMGPPDRPPKVDLWLTVLHKNDSESQLISLGAGLEDFGGAARFKSLVDNLEWEATHGPRYPGQWATRRGVVPADWYSAEELEVLRLSSKRHWDVPIQVGKNTVHRLASRPTPPVFDGPEDRNGQRNHDEIRFWANYVIPSRSGYIRDGQGRCGGLTPGDPFVIAGDQNPDPFYGDSVPGAIQQLLEHPLVDTKVMPSSEGGREQATLQAAANTPHAGDPAFDTADFAEAYGPPPD
jgi:hypothetical protein